MGPSGGDPELSEDDLIQAIGLATKARQWTLVTKLGAQLEALQHRASVVDLGVERTRRGK
ncbi:MAG: hypothetical protein HS104_14405 [Polyangiaceae bacterium]|nr:hypothetical protein [Polyangiaceae bacterium]MCL4748897.1 hypothetical protein [Myxococcales bacterium]